MLHSGHQRAASSRARLCSCLQKSLTYLNRCENAPIAATLRTFFFLPRPLLGGPHGVAGVPGRSYRLWYLMECCAAASASLHVRVYVCVCVVSAVNECVRSSCSRLTRSTGPIAVWICECKLTLWTINAGARRAAYGAARSARYCITLYNQLKTRRKPEAHTKWRHSVTHGS